MQKDPKMKKKIILTSPDYPPKKGGLSTFTLNIEKILKSLNINYDLLIWKNLRELKNKKKELERATHIINVQFMAGFFLPPALTKNINFYHGSEIMFYSPLLHKRIIKILLKPRMLNYIQQSYLNIFVSKFTLDKIKSNGLKVDYGRDIVLHNAVDVSGVDKHEIKTINGSRLVLVCVARDVEHKNLSGCVKFAEYLAEISAKQVYLYLTSEIPRKSDKVEIKLIKDVGDERREQIYQEAHFNLLLSKDHSKKGFYEGFGLTVLEAGKYGTPSIVLPTGGLSESVHHLYTGWIVDNIDYKSVKKFWNGLNEEKYKEISHNCYCHTHNSHSLLVYEKLFKRILEIE